MKKVWVFAVLGTVLVHGAVFLVPLNNSSRGGAEARRVLSVQFSHERHDTTDSANRLTGSASRLTGSASQLTGSISQLTGSASRLTDSTSQLTDFASQLTDFASPLTEPASQLTDFANEKANVRLLITNQIEQYVNVHLQYPVMAKRRGVQGTVCVSFQVCSDGRIESAAVAKSSGNSLLDKAALQLIAGLPVLDTQGLTSPEDFTINIAYKLL
jgi:TonB family protein